MRLRGCAHPDEWPPWPRVGAGTCGDTPVGAIGAVSPWSQTPRVDDPAEEPRTTRAGLARVVPVLQWLPRYDRRALTPDTIAGLTVWALLVPEALAYAAIAGVPAQYGLYAAPLALLGYVLFGTSRELFVGPSATVATMSAATVGVVAVSTTSASTYVALSAALALLVGLLKAGFIARSSPSPCWRASSSGSASSSPSGSCPRSSACRSRRGTPSRSSSGRSATSPTGR